jgi:hypothetical protein
VYFWDFSFLLNLMVVDLLPLTFLPN